MLWNRYEDIEDGKWLNALLSARQVEVQQFQEKVYVGINNFLAFIAVQLLGEHVLASLLEIPPPTPRYALAMTAVTMETPNGVQMKTCVNTTMHAEQRNIYHMLDWTTSQNLETPTNQITMYEQ